jgi:phospholipid/cholesterol/gamma-HCH transport system substrate-binding protein
LELRRPERSREPLDSEQGSTLARILAVAALVVVIALAAYAIFGRGSGYEVTATFQSASQLVKGNQVRVGGAPVGKITDIGLDDDGRAAITMSIDDDIAPLHERTTATIRVTSLSGVANRYVSLVPGPNNAPELADGGRIGGDDTTAAVDLDQVFDSLDERTRAGLRNLIRGQADWYAGRSTQAAAATRYLAPFLGSTTDLTRELALDQQVLERFLRDGATTVSAIAARRDDLAGLVRNTSTAAGAIGDENVALSQTLSLLPPTLRKANTTFVNLRSTLDDLDVLVNASKPATKDLAPFLAQVRPLTAAAEPTVADLRTLIRRPGPSNDLIDLLSVQPRLAKLTSSAFPRAIRTLDRAEPVVDYGRGYTPDLAAWFTKFGTVAAAYDANGHYARIMPMFAPTNLVNGTLVANEPIQRLDNFSKPNLGRCPGGAMQPAPDGSAPRAFEGCNVGASPATTGSP